VNPEHTEAAVDAAFPARRSGPYSFVKDHSDALKSWAGRRGVRPRTIVAFDVLSIDGEGLRALPLVQRKRRLARIMPRVESRLVLLDAIPARGDRLFELACVHDLEGIVAKHRDAP